VLADGLGKSDGTRHPPLDRLTALFKCLLLVHLRSLSIKPVSVHVCSTAAGATPRVYSQQIAMHFLRLDQTRFGDRDSSSLACWSDVKHDVPSCARQRHS
jgi:hypothetical protein